MTQRLTGKTRIRQDWRGRCVVQVEFVLETKGGETITLFRDARMEDLIPEFKLSAVTANIGKQGGGHASVA